MKLEGLTDHKLEGTWNKVEDRLPKEGDLVLVYTGVNHMFDYDLASWDGDNWRNQDWDKIHSITHWMHIPKEPNI